MFKGAITHTDAVTDDGATVCRIMFWLIGVSHAERWKAFLIDAALADLHTHTHTHMREIRGGEVRQIMREKEEETSAGPSAHPSVLEPDLGQTLSPTSTHTAAGRQEHHDLR